MDLNLTKEQLLHGFAMLPPFHTSSVKQEEYPVICNGIKRTLVFKKDYNRMQWVLSEVKSK
jgi:hypothetical protein